MKPGAQSSQESPLYPGGHEHCSTEVVKPNPSSLEAMLAKVTLDNLKVTNNFNLSVMLYFYLSISYAVSLVPLLSVARIRMKSTSAKAMSKCSRFTKSRSALIHESS